ncbi:MAG: hypothetical protein ACJ75J_09240 [Cytophagaceae bacterium]
MYYAFNNSKGEVRSHLVEYLRIINADGKEHGEETKKLIEIAEKNGMRGSELKTLIADIDSEKIITPSNNAERFDQLFYLVNLVVGDDYLLNHSEFDFCIEVATKMGIPANKSASIVKEMHNGIKHEVKEPELNEKVLAMM